MKIQKLILVLFCLGVIGVAAAARQPAAGQSAASGAPPAYAFAEPGISPDGREIAFASGGEIWTVPATGGEARLLITDPATDRRPMYSPDGRSIAFMSTRTGGGDIYILTLATGATRRLTWDDGLENLDGWSRDGRWIYFSSTSRDIANMNDVFRVDAAGGTPMPVSADRYVSEFGAAASPDGKRIALVARGNSAAQWWRKGSSHLDQSELWLMNLDGDPDYALISPRGARQSWPMWSGDGRNIFYVSDRGGAENVWTRPASAGGSDRKLTKFSDGRVLFPSATTNGATIAFERDFGIWTLDTASGDAKLLQIIRRGATSSPAPERVRQTASFTDLALSPDGRKIAFIARGDIFAASARDAGDATRVTDTGAIESQPMWSSDSRRLVYVATTPTGRQIVLHDFGTNASKPLTTGTATDMSPVWSPDGKQLAFLRNHKELRVMDVAAGSDRVLATATFGDTLDDDLPTWSPDGRWIAIFTIGEKRFSNVELVPVASGVLRPATFLANAFTSTIAWSNDGTFLVFATNQRTEPGQFARVDLVPRAPKFREDLFRDLFSEPRNNRAPATEIRTPTPEPSASAAPRSTTTPDPVLAGIRNRLSFIPLGLDVRSVTLSPDGKTAALVAAAAGQTNIYAYSLDELAADRPVARQITTSTGAKSNVQFTPDGRELVYLDAGRVQIANLERRDSRALAVTAEMTVDFSRERQVVFDQAWTMLRDNFYDAGFNGVNWEASHERYGKVASSAATPDELRRVISLMIGDLNASHLGISGAGAGTVIGRLGLDFDRRAAEAGGKLMVTDVTPLGPAALAGGIAIGDSIASINGKPIGARTNLDEELANTIDRRVVLGVVPRAGGAARDVVVRPTTQAAAKALLYRDWVDTNREYVLKTSGGRLGYVHMINMSAAALDQLIIDLDVGNHRLDGVVIDIRNNNGGFVNAYALDIFARQPYLRMSTRNVSEAPARGVLGQRALEAPTVLVTNQHSLSDAEDFTEGYRTLKLGSVVGEPTAGWIVYTWDERLIDGSTLRLPRQRVRASDGSDMERVPRKVDVEVMRPLGESLTGKDAQLDEAIRVLLKRLGRSE